PARRPLWVACVERSIVGWLSFQSFYGRPAYQATAEISVYVAPGQRRGGIGRALLGRAVGAAPGLGLKILVGLVFGHHEPLPVIASYGAAGGSVLAFSVVHVVVYTWIFYLLARWIGSLARRAHLRGFVPAVLILAIAFGVGAAPIYGSGESLLGGHKLRSS